MFCKNCGAELPDGATFCTSCGAQLTAEAPQQSAPAAAPAAAPVTFDAIRQKLFAPALSKLLTIIFLLVAAGSTLLVTVGNFDNTFMGVVSDLITLVLLVCLYSAVAVLLLIGKTELAKKALYPIFAYWLITTVLGDVSVAGNIVAGQNGLVIVYSLFEFLLALALITAAIMFVLTGMGKANLTKIAWILVLCVLALSALALLLRLIRLIDVGANWTRYFSILGECAFNFGMIFAVSAVAGGKKEQKTEAAPAE